MHRIRFIHPPPDNHVARRRALIASYAFHGVALTALLLLTLYYRSYPVTLALPTGAGAGAPTISLHAIMVQSTPSQATPTPVPPPIPMPPVSTSVPDPVIPTKIPDVGIPVLAPVPTHSAVAKTETHHRTTTPHAAASPSVQAAASTVAANFSRGYNSMPHPPYPEEAVNLNWTGTVIVLVEFDEKGDVVSTTISKSSGIPLLDTSTCSFIRTNWHSMKFAGLSIPQPVEYKLY